MTTTTKPLCADGTQSHRWILSDSVEGVIPAYCPRCENRWSFNGHSGEVSGDTYGRAYNHDRVPVVLGTTMATGDLGE